MSIVDTKNPNDPRRWNSEFPDDQERRFEELFARSQKLAARVTAIESEPDLTMPLYTKFKNGTLICFGQINAVLSGGGIINDIFTFPVAFLFPPITTVTSLPRPAPNAGAVVVVDIFATTTTTVQARARTWDGAGWVITDFRCQVVAVGQWK